ncbi:MAG: hypothetical protein OXH00_23005 [Candidatus Poribacteria bacterium]|nr:hypothetical protein [Candidatus Poribacteria bacterium]
MKTLVVNQKNIGTSLPISGFVLLASLLLTIVPALANEFEVGTQFGISHSIINDDDSSFTATTTAIPSGITNPGYAPPSLYATWFPSQQFAIGPEFQFGRVTNSFKLGEWGEDSVSQTSLYLGGRAAYFFRNHAMSSPFAVGRISLTMLSGEGLPDDGATVISLGAGLGYQWHVRSALILRIEGLYHRILSSEPLEPLATEQANAFRLAIGIGTRFGNSKSQNP